MPKLRILMKSGESIEVYSGTDESEITFKFNETPPPHLNADGVFALTGEVCAIEVLGSGE